MEHLNMPAPQPARNPLTDDSILRERFELISKKYSAAGLEPQETRRLAEIEEYLDLQDIQTADSIDARSNERMARINATLDRVESAIPDLQAIKPN